MKNSRRGARTIIYAGLIAGACAVGVAQQVSPPASATAPAAAPAMPWVEVKPIDPPASPLPPESATAQVTRFSFVAYGDTRSASASPGDADTVHPEHTRVMDRMLDKV